MTVVQAVGIILATMRWDPALPTSGETPNLQRSSPASGLTGHGVTAKEAGRQRRACSETDARMAARMPRRFCFGFGRPMGKGRCGWRSIKVCGDLVTGA